MGKLYKPSELEFLKRISKTGHSFDIDKELIDSIVALNKTYELHSLSVSQETYLATCKNFWYVVKIKRL